MAATATSLRERVFAVPVLFFDQIRIPEGRS